LKFNWGLGYLAEVVGQAFQELYENTHGGLDAWTAFWHKVATVFHDKSAVLGYELMNEPFGGDVYRNLSLLLPSVVGRQLLMPAYDQVASAIREADHETIIMFEAMSGNDLAALGLYGSGFTSVPGGSAYANRSCLSWHYYPLVRAFAHHLLDQQIIRSVKDAERLQTTAMLTEFSVTHFDNPELDSKETAYILDRADEHFQSWAFWDVYMLIDEQGSFRASAMNVFVRPYASAVAGIPIKMSFDRGTSVFQLVFKPDFTITEPTEVMVPPLRYPNGYDVLLTDGLKIVQCPGNGMLCVRAVENKSIHIPTANITVSPKGFPNDVFV